LAHVIRLKWSKFIGYEDSGVYEYFVRLKSGDKNLIYVGEADDLRKRSQEHLSVKEPNECLKKNLKEYKWDFRYAILASKADRQDAEQALYDKYKPKCNKVRPSGSGRNLEIKIIEE